MNISTNISSMQAHQTMMNTTAHNVANVNTDGFVPSDTRMSSSGNSIVAQTAQADDDGSLKSQTDLSKEITDQIIAGDVTAVNATVIRTQDDMLGTLLDMKA